MMTMPVSYTHLDVYKRQAMGRNLTFAMKAVKQMAGLENA